MAEAIKGNRFPAKRTVSVIGCGRAGSSIAFHLVAGGICDELILNDLDQDKAAGEEFDLSDTAAFGKTHPQVRRGSIKDCAATQAVIIAAGAPRAPAQTEMENYKLTRNTCCALTGELLSEGFQGIFLLLCNKVETIQTELSMQAGFPADRLLGLGNALNTMRLRSYMERSCRLQPGSIQNFYLMGGYNSPCGTFSWATAGEQPLEQVLGRNHFEPPYGELLEFAQERGRSINLLKYPTYYGVAAAVSAVTGSILEDQKQIFSLSVQLQGEYGLWQQFASVPVRIGKNGAEEIIAPPLNEEEAMRFLRSAEEIKQENKRYIKE